MIVFGYENANPFTMHIPVSSENEFDVRPIDRGQPEDFLTGKISGVFSIRSAHSSIPVWKIGSKQTSSRLPEKECATDAECVKSDLEQPKKQAFESLLALAQAARRAALRLATVTTNTDLGRDKARIDRKVKTQQRKAEALLLLIPNQALSCSQLSAGCTDVDQEATIKEINRLSRQLLRHSSRLYRRIGLASGVKILPEDRIRQTRNRKVLQKGADALLQVPRFITSCE